MFVLLNLVPSLFLIVFFSNIYNFIDKIGKEAITKKKYNFIIKSLEQTDPLELKDYLLANNYQLTNMDILNYYTGKFTGRSPQDRYFVRDELTNNSIDWNTINLPMSKDNFNLLKNDLDHYLSSRDIIFTRYFFIKNYESNINFTFKSDSPVHSLFVYNMFERPGINNLKNWNNEWTILHSPNFEADPKVHGVSNSNFVVISFKEKYIIIGGTGYTGEIKKSVFTTMNYLLPFHKNFLTMHCSANIGYNDDNLALFFGLSGTGKTTLSSSEDRLLIGDDEHVWTENNKIFNLEGGCYAKVVNLKKELEPQIWDAIHTTALLENVCLENGNPNFEDVSITENTRVSYPLFNIKNRYRKDYAPGPKNIFFLAFDAFGILPPMSKLNKQQAIYHFISGYTSKIAGTEINISSPQVTFSHCYGAPFMPLPIHIYANLFLQKVEQYNPNIWLLNTGWIESNYGNGGQRIPLKYTRQLLNFALNFKNENELEFIIDDYFGFKTITKVGELSDSFLVPEKSWKNNKEYHENAKQLVELFNNNFNKLNQNNYLRKFESGGPKFTN